MLRNLLSLPKAPRASLNLLSLLASREFRPPCPQQRATNSSFLGRAISGMGLRARLGHFLIVSTSKVGFFSLPRKEKLSVCVGAFHPSRDQEFWELSGLYLYLFSIKHQHPVMGGFFREPGRISFSPLLIWVLLRPQALRSPHSSDPSGTAVEMDLLWEIRIYPVSTHPTLNKPPEQREKLPQGPWVSPLSANHTGNLL